MKIIRIDSRFGSPVLGGSLIADSSIRPHKRPLFLPDGRWRAEIRPAIRIDRLGKAIAEDFASRYYNEMALVNVLSPEVRACLSDSMMDDAVVAGQWMPIAEFPQSAVLDSESAGISIDYNDVNRLIHCLSADATFKTGDIIILPETLFRYNPEIGQTIKVTSPEGSTLIEFNIK